MQSNCIRFQFLNKEKLQIHTNVGRTFGYDRYETIVTSRGEIILHVIFFFLNCLIGMTMRTSYGHEGVDDLSIILFLTVRFYRKGKYMKLKVNLFISPPKLGEF